jgi:hypothetical protein
MYAEHDCTMHIATGAQETLSNMTKPVTSTASSQLACKKTAND